jgi:hypothetical protein
MEALPPLQLGAHVDDGSCRQRLRFRLNLFI